MTEEQAERMLELMTRLVNSVEDIIDTARAEKEEWRPENYTLDDDS